MIECESKDKTKIRLKYRLSKRKINIDYFSIFIVCLVQDAKIL